jgi:hypothetical protein
VIDAAEAAQLLIAEADRCRARAAHCAEQHDLETAAAHLQVEYGLHLVAHVFAALGESEDEAA